MQLSDKLLGVLVGALAIACAWEAHRVWTGWRGPGTMLLVIALIFAALAVGYFLPRSHAPSRVSWPSREEYKAIGAIGIAFVLYLIAMPWLGFTLSTWLFMAIVSKSASPASSTFSVVAIMGVLAAASYGIFGIVLDTALPRGVVGF